MAATAEVLTKGLSEPLAAMGVDLESVEVQKAGRRHVVRVVVDKDGGVDLDLVAAVSQRISALLDEVPLSDALPGPFVLEVTSPGVDRPLTEPRHWRRAVGRLVDVTLMDDTTVSGRVSAVPSEGSVLLDTGDGEMVLKLDAVRRALVQVEFNRPEAEAAAVVEAGTDAVDEEE